jgi:translation initiation factor IF-3
VRVIGADGKQVGIMSTKKALDLAVEQEYDLVEVSPNSKPPVCRIMDYGKYKYQQRKKQKLSKKKQHIMHVKELQMSPKIEEHDYHFKVKHAQEFLESGDKVKIQIKFRGRQILHKEFALELLQRIAADLEEVSKIENEAKMEGRNMVMILSPVVRAQKKTPGNEQQEQQVE